MATTVWKGHLAFGLVSIPVRLYKAARKERVRLRYVDAGRGADLPQQDKLTEHREVAQPATYPDLGDSRVAASGERTTGNSRDLPAPVSRMEQQMVRESDSSPVERRDLARGFEYEPDRFVVVEQEELRRLRRKTSPDMQISQFVRLDEIDPLYFEASYYVVPDTGGEKPYAVLFAVLRNTGYVALSSVAMHGRDHVIVVRPGRFGLIAHTMFYSDEIRPENEFRTDLGLAGAKELELGSAFVEALSGSFDPDQFKDTYREELQALIEGKVTSQGAAPAKPAKPVSPPVDILEALKASLARAREPKAGEPARKAPDKIREVKGKTQRRKA